MDVKGHVKERYGRIARESRGGGGGATAAQAAKARGAEALATAVGYGAEELSAVPEGANLGLGCGNPLALAEAKAGDTVLDLGSGAGFDCFLAAAQVGPTGRVIGVDMTEEMIARAEENARRSGHTNVEFRLGEIERLPVADESVNLVISNCVLNLVPDKAQAFREIARVLKPGGRVMISDILRRGELPADLLRDADVHAACIGGALEAPEYLGLLRAAGLTDVELLSETDAAELFAALPECARDGLGADARLLDTVEQLRGKLFSSKVRARKPVGR